MTITRRSKQEYEALLQQAVGKRLSEIRYYEINNNQVEPFYLSPNFQGHLLDFGCDLIMSDDSTFGVVWDGEFFQYGVGVVREPLENKLSNSKVWNVTEDSNWVSVVNRCITKATVHWSWVKYENSPEVIEYPQDIELEFDNGIQIYFSASQYSENNDTLFGISDDIAVVFDRIAAKKYCLGQFAIHG